jgi:uncharacterized membrane protein
VPEPDEHASLAHMLGEQWPNFAAYVVSFLTIGVIWINHHAMLRRLQRVDQSILMLNIVLLMSIVVLPFTTALMARYINEAHGATLAGLVYGGSFTVMSALFIVMQRHVLVNRVHMLHESLTPQLRQTILRRNVIGIFPYVVATAGALVSPYVTLGISALLAIYFGLPIASPDTLESAQS